MKQRVSSLDVKVLAHELSSSLSTLRLSNVYDLSSRIFLFKFSIPDHRQQLLVDSGFRCHLTTFARATAAAPSPFVTRLRKFLRSRRVTSVDQVGTDRVLQIQFSSGQYRLFLEFYAGGNILLTNKDLDILAILRIVPAAADQEELRVGLKYSLSNRQNYGGVPALSRERVTTALRDTIAKGPANATAKKSKTKPGNALRKALATSITEFPPMLVDHALTVTEFDATLLPEQILQDDALVDKLMLALQEAERVVQEITGSDVTTGYIVAKPNPSTRADHDVVSAHGSIDGQNFIYEDFHPFKPRQFEKDPTVSILSFDGFNKTVDEFFSSIEGQRLESRLQEKEDNAKKKLEAARQDHEKRLGGLQSMQELNVRKAQAIEANVQRVEEAVGAINGLVGQGMDWVEIARLIEMEQNRKNPVAMLIKLPLKLYENTATLLLGEAEEEDDYDGDATDSDVSESDDDGKQQTQRLAEKRLSIDIDLALSPWANARQYYDQKRSAAVKERKTLQSSTKALKNTERKITADLKKGLKQEKQVLRPVRQQHWFEKFIFFISSDGYLILGGKDLAQNEILYKRLMKRGDVYVHADQNGAAMIIIKNKSNTPDAPIPPSTLSQAGNLCIATSSAWDSKAVMSAWWVHSDQVSKTTPTGEFLATGSFAISGKKNFLPPAQLLLGFGVIFQIDEESQARHVRHRIPDEGSATAAEDSSYINQREDDLLDNERVQAEGHILRDESDDEVTQDMESRSHSESDSDEEEKSSEDEKSNPLQIKGQRSSALDSQHVAEEGEAEKSHKGGDELDEGYDSDNASNVENEADSVATTAPDISVSDRAGAAPNPRTQQPNKPIPRGKRGKAKKIASKYANQDDEDRALAMSLLGSTAAAQKAASDAASKAAKAEELAFQKARRREQHERAARVGKEHEERRQRQLESAATLDDDDDDESASQQQHVDLASFIGTPLPGDTLLAAIPVCAPLAALATYKYKAKLQPGTTKKGKAVKEILSRWLANDGAEQGRRRVDDRAQDVDRPWPREMELLRAWKDTEIVNTLPVGKVRVMMPGGGNSAGGSGGGASAKGKGRGGRGSKKKK